MASKKPKCLTLAEKSDILEQLNNGVTVTSLSQKYGVAKSTVCAIKTKKMKILQTVSETISGPGKRRTLKSGAEPIMEQKLYSWFLKQRENQFPISGAMIKEKAKDFHEKLHNGKCNFNASDGWLSRFKRRYGIRLSKSPREKLAVRPVILSFKEELRAKIEQFELCNDQIYNAVETSLFWKSLPGKSNVISTERISLLVCSNATGFHKLKPFIIGKSRWFSNFSNPVDYVSCQTSWITADIFQQWFYKNFIPQVKAFLEERNLPNKALLLLDCTLFRPLENNLQSEDGKIFVMYLPLNVTPLHQQMNHVIKITKLIYRKHLLSSLIAKNPGNLMEAIRKVTHREAVANLAVAWDALQKDDIKKCWNKILSYEEDEIPLNELERLLIYNEITANITDLLNSNTGVIYTSDDIMSWNEDLSNHGLVEEEEYNTNLEIQEEEINISAEQVMQSFNQVICWSEKQNVDYSDIMVLRKLREKAVYSSVKSKCKETNLYSFFCVDQIEYTK